MRRSVAVVALLAIATSGRAQDPLPAPSAPEYSLTTGSLTLVTSGPNREYFTARFSLRIFTDHNLLAAEDRRDSIHLRTTLTASQDGGAVAIGNPRTFQSIVPEIEYRKSLPGFLQAAAIANVTFSADGTVDGNIPVLDPRMFTGFVGIRGSLQDGSWLFAGVGKSGPVGPEFALDVRGGRPIGKGDVGFEYILPLRADALQNRAWVLQLTTTYQVAKGEVR